MPLNKALYPGLVLDESRKHPDMADFDVAYQHKQTNRVTYNTYCFF